MAKLYGLIGRDIAYSFSRRYFAEKFAAEHITDATYVNYDIDDISNFDDVIRRNENLSGLNVTIPYKESVIGHLDKLDATAAKIGAVNTIKFHANGVLEGFNTDEYGFRTSLAPLLEPHHQKALILGTGGASKAVAFALEKLGIDHKSVSRLADHNNFNYNELASVFADYKIIVNTTPLGTFPDVNASPDVPYELFSPKHIAYDLVYNPQETQFLKKAKARGATTKNGLEMLQLQAEKAWEIWNS